MAWLVWIAAALKQFLDYQHTLSTSHHRPIIISSHQHPLINTPYDAPGRRMDNVDLLMRMMSASLPPPDYDLHFNCTSSHYLSAVDQIKMAALAHVVIAEHGAFQSNMMYCIANPPVPYPLSPVLMTHPVIVRLTLSIEAMHEISPIPSCPVLS